jgi:hypothetical protein
VSGRGDAARLVGVSDSPETAERPRRVGPPGWVFAVVPFLLVGLLVAVVAIAARSSSDDDDAADDVAGPAAELPAVTAAASELIGSLPPAGQRAGALGARAGEIAAGLVTISDELEFAARFDRLPPAEAKLLGRSLGAIQRELSPSGIGGPRGDGDRHDDTVFALELVWAAAPILDPDADPSTQALNVLPAAVPLADDGDAIVAALIGGDYARAAELLDPVLSDAGAAEIVSGLAGDISDRVGALNDPARLREFQTAYNLQIP